MDATNAAKLRRVDARGLAVRDQLTLDVPCDFANHGQGGTHQITVVLYGSGQLARITCTCEGEHGGAGMAVHRLGVAGTCGNALGWLRRWVLGEDGDASMFVHQHFTKHALAFLAHARSVALDRRAAHKQFAQFAQTIHTRARARAHERSELLSRLFAERMGWTPAVLSRARASWDTPPTFTIECDRKGRPRKAIIDKYTVATRSPGMPAWFFDSKQIAHAAAACCEVAFGCPSCTERNATRAYGPRFGVAGSRKAEWSEKKVAKHAKSKLHITTFERLLLDVLIELPGVGGSELSASA